MICEVMGKALPFGCRILIFSDEPQQSNASGGMARRKDF